MNSDWKELWEDHAEQEANEMQASDEGALLQRIQSGYYGSYYTIWYAIADKQNPQQSAPVLIEALIKIETDRVVYYDELNAIHCAEALCQLFKITDEAQKSDLVYLNRLQSAQFFREKLNSL